MNIEVYLFGEFNSGYTQYPEDHTKPKFRKFNSNAKSITQIVIHREGNLMYYGYVRKLEQDHYIGFCVVVNGQMLTKFDALFSLFESAISTLVINGQLIHFNDQGNIVSSVDRLYINHEEIGLLTESFQAGFSHMKSAFKPLPAVSYGMSKDSLQNFSIDDNIEDIVKSGHTYGYTYIYKSKGFNTTQLNSYKEIVNRLNSEKSDLTQRYNELTKEHSRTVKQKKQHRFVFILSLLILGCFIGLLSLNSNLSNANKIIDSQSSSLNSKNSRISDLETENRALAAKNSALDVKYQEAFSSYQQTEAALDSIQGIIEGRQPFLIKSTSFDFNTGYLSFVYFGFKRDFLKLQVRAYSDEGYSYNNSEDVDIYPGDSIAKIYLSQSLNNQKWYSFEVLKGNIILGGDRH